ncbi:MAG: RING finger protein [Planctomycetota bacterium]|nr:RING finger protein [Planctomycetota bacterium]
MSDSMNKLRFEDAAVQEPATRCGLCLDEMSDEDLWVCPDCQTPIHKLCHDEFASCITLGCPQQRKAVSPSLATENTVTIRQVGLWASKGRFFYRCLTASICAVLILSTMAFLLLGLTIPFIELFSQFGHIPADSLEWLIPQTMTLIGVGGVVGIKALRGFIASIRDLKEIVRIWRL